MQFSVPKILAFLAGASVVLSSTLPVKERVFDDGGVTFRGEIGGHAFEETGTVQEVWAKLKARHPDIELKPRSETDIEGKPSLMKRDKQLPPLCIPVPGQDWNFAESAAIDDGINYLNGIDAALHINNGCSRVSCSYNSAIWWCSDIDVTIPAWYLASYAKDIQNYCTHCVQPGNFCITGGQEFDTDDYNIIVRSDSC